MKSNFALRLIALRLQVVKSDYYSKLKRFETVKYKIVPTKLLSHFSKVNCAREVKAAKEDIRGNAKTLSLK